MALIQRILHGDGTVEERPNTYPNLRAASDAEPRNGVYLVASTFSGGRVLMLDRHFDRMERSSAILGRPVPVARERIRDVLRRMKRDAGFPECRFRVSISLDPPRECLLSMEEYGGVPVAVRENGIACATAPRSARDTPDAKGTIWIHMRGELAHRGIDPDAIDEFLLLNEADRILEGGSSNFFAVVRSGDSLLLRTADEGILTGIVRGVVLDLASGVIPVCFEPVHVNQLPDIAEAFITSSSRGVVPVRSIDTIEIGSPGPVTRDLMDRYAWWADAHCEDL